MTTSKKKILVITGTRAEYGLLKPVIDEIRASKKLELKLLVTSMHTLKRFGYTIDEIKKDKVPIACVIKISEKDDMLTALSKEIIGIKNYCEKHRPDLMVVLGDRDESFAGAIVGGHLGIPIGHIHGGDLTACVVDGLIRDSITKFSHLHFTACKSSYQRVIDLQEDKQTVFLVGAPGLDNLKTIKTSNKLKLAKELDINAKKPWLLFIMHPTQFEKLSFRQQISNPLKVIAQLTNYEKIVVYPNSDTGSDTFIKEINKYRKKKSFHIFKNLPRFQYLSLLKNVDFLIGNSSSGIIESTYFKLPTINIGNRQKGRERGENIIDTDYQMSNILKAINQARTKKIKIQCKKAKSPYSQSNTSKKIVKILEKYI